MQAHVPSTCARTYPLAHAFSHTHRCTHGSTLAHPERVHTCAYYMCVCVRSCGERGATVGCRVERCPCSYHLPCAKAAGAQFTPSHFVIACPTHKAHFKWEQGSIVFTGTRWAPCHLPLQQHGGRSLSTEDSPGLRRPNRRAEQCGKDTCCSTCSQGVRRQVAPCVEAHPQTCTRFQARPRCLLPCRHPPFPA